MFEKGQRFESSYDNEPYELVGRWSDGMVLAPVNAEKLEVLIYTESEINELIEDGKLKLIEGPEMLMG